MNGGNPSYYRARLDTFRHFIKTELPGDPLLDTGKKNSPLELLKQGFVHPNLAGQFENRIGSSSTLVADTPLSFTELCSFNTWFAMHPEKMAGIETVTSSINFPITIRGTKEDVERVVSKGLDSNKRVRIVQAKAAAKLKLLTLLKR